MKFIVRTEIRSVDGTMIWTVYRKRPFRLEMRNWYMTREEAVAAAKHLSEPDIVVESPTGARL